MGDKTIGRSRTRSPHRKSGKSPPRKQKTDFNDARTLADLLRAGMLPESYRVSDEIYDLRVVVRERYFLVSKRTDVKNRIHGLATTQGLHLVDGGNPLGKKGKKWVQENDEILKELHEVIEELNAHIDVLDKKIEKATHTIPEAKLLMTVPGVGKITALTVIAEVGDFSRFEKPEKLASFAGLVPKQRSSGEKVRLGGITHLGSKYLRTAMVETAMRIRPEYAPELHRYVESIKLNTSPKRARVALARKMLTIMWMMVTKNVEYNPLVFQKNRPSPSSSAIRKESYLDAILGA